MHLCRYIFISHLKNIPNTHNLQSCISHATDCSYLTHHHPQLLDTDQLINTTLLNPQSFPLMPVRNSHHPVIPFVNGLLPLRPAYPLRLAIGTNTHHLIRNRKLRIDSRSEGMDEFRPALVPNPEHGAAVTAEGALGAASALFRRAARFDCVVFSEGFTC
jgi:hypothetical protein